MIFVILENLGEEINIKPYILERIEGWWYANNHRDCVGYFPRLTPDSTNSIPFFNLSNPECFHTQSVWIEYSFIYFSMLDRSAVSEDISKLFNLCLRNVWSVTCLNMKFSLSASVSQMWDVCNVRDDHLIVHISAAIFLHRETYYGQKGVLCSSSSPLTTNKLYFRHQNVGLAGRAGGTFWESHFSIHYWAATPRAEDRG